MGRARCALGRRRTAVSRVRDQLRGNRQLLARLPPTRADARRRRSTDDHREPGAYRVDCDYSVQHQRGRRPGVEDLPLPTAFLAVNIAVASGLHALVWMLAYRRELFLVRPSAREVHGAIVIGLSPAAIVLASVPVAYLASRVIAQLCWLLIIPIRVAARRWAADSADGSAG